MLTERCNLKCKHCYQTGNETLEMTPAEIQYAIREITETLESWRENYDIQFTPTVNITGGEPFLRTDIFEILAKINNAGFDIYLLTNGILIDKNRARALYDIGVKGVQVSLEGPPHIHEAIRGRNSYSGSVRGIKNLLDSGLEVTLNVTLSSLNAHYFKDLYDMSLHLGVQRLGFSRLVPSGKGKSLSKKMLRVESLRKLYKEIFALDNNSLEIVTGDPVASQLRNTSDGNDRGDVPSGGCAAGLSGITVLPEGTLVPCRRLPVHIGNIRKDSFREIWATSGVLNDLRNRNKYGGKCGSCRNWAVCRGCRAIAYAYSVSVDDGDFLAEDPQCFISKV